MISILLKNAEAVGGGIVTSAPVKDKKLVERELQRSLVLQRADIKITDTREKTSDSVLLHPEDEDQTFNLLFV